MLNVSLVPIAAYKLSQKCEVNLGSLSDTIDSETHVTLQFHVYITKQAYLKDS